MCTHTHILLCQVSWHFYLISSEKKSPGELWETLLTLMTEAVDHQLQVLHSEIFKSPLFSSYACYWLSMVHGLSKTWNSVKGLESFRCTENSARDVDISFCNSLVSKIPCFINDCSFLCFVVFKSIRHTHCHHCGDIYIYIS